MGLSSSKESDWAYEYEKDVSWPPPEVSTLEQFNIRFRDLCGDIFLLPAQTEWLQILCTKLGTAEKEHTYWTENNIAEFLTAIFPALAEDIIIARTLLYRSILRLGSFPYLNRPQLSITPAILRVAVIILLQRYQGTQINAVGAYGNSNEAQTLRALLFQSMRLAPSTTLASDSLKNAVAFTPNDGYLTRAYYFVRMFHYKRHKTNATRVNRGAPLVIMEDLPCSQSADYSGIIPREQLLAFLRICSTLGSENGRISKEVEIAFVAMGAEEVTWEEFQNIMKYDETTLFNGLALFFTAFVSPPAGITKDTLQEGSREDALKLLKEAGPPSQSARYDKGANKIQ